MRRIITLLVTLIFLSVAGRSQRFLETVLNPANPQYQTVAHNGKVLIAGHNDSFLLSYNDLAFSRYIFPLVSGARLRFDSYKNPLVLFQTAVFFVLRPSPGSYSMGYLYKYSGTSYTRITITGVPVSNCIVYGESLYFLARSGTATKLYLYNGSVTTEVSGGGVPNSAGYELNVSEGYLYVSGYAFGTGTSNFIKRFDGASFFTLPYSGPAADVDEVYGVPGTTRVYFTSHERIVYYNGSTVSEVFSIQVKTCTRECGAVTCISQQEWALCLHAIIICTS